MAQRYSGTRSVSRLEAFSLWGRRSVAKVRWADWRVAGSERAWTVGKDPGSEGVGVRKLEFGVSDNSKVGGRLCSSSSLSNASLRGAEECASEPARRLRLAGSRKGGRTWDAWCRVRGRPVDAL